MSFRTILISALALVFGASAAIWVNMIRANSNGSAPETVSVVVAATDIPRFTTVSSDMLTTKEFPKDLVPPSAFTNVQEVQDRVSVITLAKGEPILSSRLSAKGAGRGMAAAIPVGMRAFTIQTPSIAAGVAGFILPGNKVDVLLTMGDSNHEQTGGGTTITLLQSVEILAVDQRVEAPSENKMDLNQLRSVTLLVTPDQAANLDLGGNKGTLHLSLRNPKDVAVARTSHATVRNLRIHQEKLWDERMQSLLTAGASLLSKLPTLQKPTPTVGGTEESQSTPASVTPPRKSDHQISIFRGAGAEEVVPLYKRPDGSYTRIISEAKPNETEVVKKPMDK